jgi:hypothetical protein
VEGSFPGEPAAMPVWSGTAGETSACAQPEAALIPPFGAFALEQR